MVRFHERYDLLLTPQMPLPAIEVGHVTPPEGGWGDEWIGWSPYTYPFNLTQQPAASVPCGFTSDGLPIALQIVASRSVGWTGFSSGADAVLSDLPYTKPRLTPAPATPAV